MNIPMLLHANVQFDAKFIGCADFRTGICNGTLSLLGLQHGSADLLRRIDLVSSRSMLIELLQFDMSYREERISHNDAQDSADFLLAGTVGLESKIYTNVRWEEWITDRKQGIPPCIIDDYSGWGTFDAGLIILFKKSVTSLWFSSDD